MKSTQISIEEAAISAIQAMAASLSNCIQTIDSFISIEWFMKKLFDNCFRYLNEPDLKLVWPNVKCLLAVASTSSTLNLLIVNKCIPFIIDLLNTSKLVII